MFDTVHTLAAEGDVTFISTSRIQTMHRSSQRILTRRTFGDSEHNEQSDTASSASDTSHRSR